MRYDVSRIIQPVDRPGPTIGDAALRAEHQTRLRPMPVHRRIDFYDTAGRLHGLIALAPLLYGIVQSWRGVHLSDWFWWMVVATSCFAIFVRRPPMVRLTPVGVSLPEKRSPEYAWDDMCQANSRAEEMDILIAGGEHVRIPYRSLRRKDVDRLKRLVKAQFEAICDRSEQAPAAQ